MGAVANPCHSPFPPFAPFHPLPSLSSYPLSFLSLSIRRPSARATSAPCLTNTDLSINFHFSHLIHFNPSLIHSYPSQAIGEGHLSAVSAVAFSPTGGLLASVGSDKLLKMWDTKAVLKAWG